MQPGLLFAQREANRSQCEDDKNIFVVRQARTYISKMRARRAREEELYQEKLAKRESIEADGWTQVPSKSKLSKHKQKKELDKSLGARRGLSSLECLQNSLSDFVEILTAHEDRFREENDIGPMAWANCAACEAGDALSKCLTALKYRHGEENVLKVFDTVAQHRLVGL